MSDIVERIKWELKKLGWTGGKLLNDSLNEIERLRAENATLREALKKSAKAEFYECGGDEETDPVERLRFFCSLAMSNQNWLDVEPFFDALKSHEAAKVSAEPVAWYDSRGIVEWNNAALSKLTYRQPLYTSPAIPDCSTCANRGEIDGLSQESHCENCIYGHRWKTSHYLAAAPRHGMSTQSTQAADMSKKTGKID